MPWRKLINDKVAGPNQTKIHTNVRAGLLPHSKSYGIPATKRTPRNPIGKTYSIAIGFRGSLVTNTTVIPPTKWIASPSERSVLDEGSSVMRLFPLCIVIGLLRGFCSRGFGINVGSSLTEIVMNVEGKKRGRLTTWEIGNSERLNDTCSLEIFLLEMRRSASFLPNT